MHHELTAAQAFGLFSAMGIFAICTILRIFLVRKITIAAGKEWDLNRPHKRSRDEWNAIKSLPPGNLRRQYRVLMSIAMGSWLVGVALLAFSAWKK